MTAPKCVRYLFSFFAKWCTLSASLLQCRNALVTQPTAGSIKPACCWRLVLISRSCRQQLATRFRVAPLCYTGRWRCRAFLRTRFVDSLRRQRASGLSAVQKFNRIPRHVNLQVGEDDYHQLKHDQCLRVDFKSFPRKFIELLESCRASSGAAPVDPESRNGYTLGEEGGGGRPTRGEPLLPSSGEPSFLARLETVVPGGFSLFSVVETNPFKELTHLSLKFRVGNDASIKTYLAARLRQVRCCREVWYWACLLVLQCGTLGVGRLGVFV